MWRLGVQAAGSSITLAEILSKTLSLDLEVAQNDRIYRFAAVCADSGESIEFGGGDLKRALRELDRFAAGREYLLGHNLIEYDIPKLAAVNSDLRILTLPCIDTLWLNPLAFPRNPYHHLVKHYQDGDLKRAQRNDPKRDAEIAVGTG